MDTSCLKNEETQLPIASRSMNPRSLSILPSARTWEPTAQPYELVYAIEEELGISIPDKRPTSSKPFVTPWSTHPVPGEEIAKDLFKQKKRDNHVALSRKGAPSSSRSRPGFRFRSWSSSTTPSRIAPTPTRWAGETTSASSSSGDSVLGLVVAEYVYATLPDAPGGRAGAVKSFVRGEPLGDRARPARGQFHPHRQGRHRRQVEEDHSRRLPRSLLDSGFAAAERFVHDVLIPEINKVLENRHAKDYKTLLQEHVQKRLKTYPRYRIVRKHHHDNMRVGDPSFRRRQGQDRRKPSRKRRAPRPGKT